jgi:CheY-like chemotaxis protein
VHILIVEDEPDVASTLKRVIESSGNCLVEIEPQAQRVVQILQVKRPDILFAGITRQSHHSPYLSATEQNRS